jgi:hypothetical protein
MIGKPENRQQNVKLFLRSPLNTIRMTNCDPESIAERLLIIFPAIRDRLALGYAITVNDHNIRLRLLPIEIPNEEAV